jgi:hypothetical protein
MRSRYRLNRSALTATGQLSLGQVQFGTSIGIRLIHFRSCSTEPASACREQVLSSQWGSSSYSSDLFTRPGHNETCRF